jgi:[acyl-carrier-protein] S-malonyltransferase
MQADLSASFEAVEATYAQASGVLGYDLWRLVQDGDAEALAATVITQPAMLTAGVAAWRVWQAAGGGETAMMAGHSLGEYTALVCAGAVSFEDALAVVKRRSELMQSAVPAGAGAMAAIIGLDDEAAERVCREVSDSGVAEAVNYNSPGQVVIAGDRTAVERAIGRAENAGARRAILLPVSVPAHSSLMRPAGEELAVTLAETDFSTPSITVFNATDATPYSDADDIRSRLSRQVYHPVKWVDTVNAMREAGASRFVECGPGKVLAGLSRRIDRGTPVAALDSTIGLEKALQA